MKKNTPVSRAIGTLAVYRVLLLVLSLIAVPSAALATASQQAGSDAIFRKLILDRTAGGTIDIITVKGDRLLDRTLPDDAATPLVRVARGAFGFADDPTFLVFIRDTSGSVTQCLWHLPSGQTTSQRIQ